MAEISRGAKRAIVVGVSLVAAAGLFWLGSEVRGEYGAQVASSIAGYSAGIGVFIAIIVPDTISGKKGV